MRFLHACHLVSADRDKVVVVEQDMDQTFAGALRGVGSGLESSFGSGMKRSELGRVAIEGSLFVEVFG
jgi:hypothetical protein